MKRLSRIAAQLAAAVIAGGCFSIMTVSAKSTLKGDMNGDSVIGKGDVRLLRVIFSEITASRRNSSPVLTSTATAG